MSVYYEDDLVTLYHGDCREEVAWREADVLVTDPPYGMKHYETDITVLDGPTLAEWVEHFVTASVFGYPERLIGLCVDGGVKPSEWVTWWPTNGALRGTNMHGLWKESEAVAIFGTHVFSTLRQSRTSASRRIIAANYDVGAKGRGDSHGDPNTRRVGDVWTDAAPGLAFQSHLRLHPNEKPQNVMERLVAGMLPGTVADPFAGSGSTLVAAKQLGRRAIGVEIDERYRELAARRLAQDTLFGGDVA